MGKIIVAIKMAEIDLSYRERLKEGNIMIV